MAQRQCYLTVAVKYTDYDEVDEYVISTTANGEEVHGKCSPLDGATVDGMNLRFCPFFFLDRLLSLCGFRSEP